MLDVAELECKGIVACPACGKEFVFVYSDSIGHASIPCIRCKRILMVNFEKMIAVLVPPQNRNKLKSN